MTGGAGRRLTAAWLGALVVWAAAPGTLRDTAAATCTQPRVTSAAEDTGTYNLFGTYAAGSGFHWVAGDGSIPVRLPDGRTAWLFGDSLVRDSGGGDHFVNNVFVIQQGSTLSTIAGGTQAAPESLIRPATAGNWYWPSAGFIENGRLMVLVQEYRTPSGGGWQWVNNAIVAFDTSTWAQAPPAGAYGSNTGLPWGFASPRDSTFTYVYAQEEVLRPDGFRDYFWRLARFPNGGSGGFWEFWDLIDGTARWSPEAWQTTRLVHADGRPVSAQLGSVVRFGSGYLALSIDPLQNATIDSYFSCSAQGPWTARQVLFQLPQRSESRYLARGYQNGSGKLLIAYSVANGRPRYVQVQYSMS